MRRGKHRKFGRQSIQRQALTKSLVTALIRDEKIKTTLPKAKSLASSFARVVSRAKKGGLLSIRDLNTALSINSVKKLISELLPKMDVSQGGYTRIIKLGKRKSDGAEMALIEIIKKEKAI